MNIAQANASTVRRVLYSPGTIVSLNASVRTLISAPVRRWRDEVVQRLNELAALCEGWDGYAGRPVNFETANFALRLLEVTCGFDAPTPQIVPGSDGDLQLEWHVGSVDIELHVRGPNDVIAWRSIGDTLDGEELILTNDFTAVVSWIADLPEPFRDDAFSAA